VYTDEGPLAYRIAEARVREGTFREQAAGATEEIGAALTLEADVQKTLAESLLPNSEIAADPRYALPEGGFELAMRLADDRALDPSLLAVDPAPEQAAGDRAIAKGVMLVAAGVPVGLTLFLGALATAFGAYRRPLSMAGGASRAKRGLAPRAPRAGSRWSLCPPRGS
jgi:hypothetical protein